MSEELTKAHELYQKYGLQKANFIAFDHMQQSSAEADVDFWLHVINQIALLDMQNLAMKDSVKSNKWGNA